MFEILAEAEFETLTTTSLLACILGTSVVVWRDLIIRRRQGRPFLEWNEAPRPRWRSAAEMVVVYVSLIWLVSHLLPHFLAMSAPPRATIDRSMLVIVSAINFCLVFVLWIALRTSGGSCETFGLITTNPKEQFEIGVRGYFAAAIPMAVSLLVTLPFRPQESQHSLLKLLSESGDVSTILLIAVAAVASAPLIEELLFRVILQGWLTSLVPSTAAIVVTAVAFSLVHGWRDGLALLPLALILGYVFHRRQSYLAVVVIHALFNATMLVFQLLNPGNPRDENAARWSSGVSLSFSILSM